MQQKFISNLVLIVLLNLLIKPLSIFGIDAAVQNRVGAADYGLYFSLLNFTYLFNIFLDLGINNFTTKNVAQYPEIVPKYLGKVLTVRAFLFVVYALITMSVGLIIGYNSNDFKLLYFLIFNQFLITLIAYFRSHFAGMMLFKTDAILSVLDRLLLILICGFVLYTSMFNNQFNIEWFIWIQTICYLLTFVIGFILLISQTGLPKIRFHKTFSIAIIQRSIPYAILIVLMMLYTRTDSVMIERLHPNGQVESGIYAQGYRLLDAVFMFGMLFTNLLFPIFSRMLKVQEDVRNLFKMSSKMLIWGSVVLATFSCFNAGELLGLIYNQEVERTIPSFQLLMITFVGMSISLIYGTLLTASGNLKLLNSIALIGLVVNVIGNSIFIPIYGAFGAALTTLATQFCVAGIQFIVVNRQFDIKVVRSQVLLFPAFILLLVGGLYFASHYHISIMIQLLFLVVTIFVFRVISIQALKELFGPKKGASLENDTP